LNKVIALKAKDTAFVILFIVLILVVINLSKKLGELNQTVEALIPLGELNQTVKALVPRDNPATPVATVVTGFASGLSSI
jgi:hypothetical protein